MRTFTLATDRLTVRPLPMQAAAALLDDRLDDRDAAFRAMGVQPSEEWPDPNLAGVLRRHADASADTECFGVWLMIERGSVTVVGDIGFHGPPDDDGIIELGYSVIPSRRRRGYVTEAAGALIEWARSQTSVRVIVAGCDPDNVPSVRALERLGFERTSIAEEEIRWRYGPSADG